MCDDVPFPVLMQQAADIKFAQLAQDRRKYDSNIKWYRDSLFGKEDIVLARNSGDFDKMMKFSMACRTEGNNLVKMQEYEQAILQYERALAVWKWIESTLLDWRKQAIEDKDLREKEYEPRNEDEKKLVHDQFVSNLSNLSLCYLRTKQYSDCIAVCSQLLTTYDATHSKAYYRRAQARILPPTSGTTDYQLALMDLKKALELNPANKTIAKEYYQLQKQLKEQQEKDVKSYHNFFQTYEGALTKEQENDKLVLQKENEDNITISYEDVEQELVKVQEEIEAYMTQLKYRALRKEQDIHTHTNDGNINIDSNETTTTDMNSHLLSFHIRDEEEERKGHEYYESLLHKQIVLKEALSTQKANTITSSSTMIKYSHQPAKEEKCIDFLNPTEEMIADAALHNVDLVDPKVRNLLANLQAAYNEQADSKDSDLIPTTKTTTMNENSEKKNIPSSSSSSLKTTTAETEEKKACKDIFQDETLQRALDEMYRDEAKRIVAQVLSPTSSKNPAVKKADTTVLEEEEDEEDEEEEDEEVDDIQQSTAVPAKKDQGEENYEFYAALLKNRIGHLRLHSVLGNRYTIFSPWILPLQRTNSQEEMKEDPLLAHSVSELMEQRRWKDTDRQELYQLVKGQMMEDIISCYRIFQKYDETKKESIQSDRVDETPMKNDEEGVSSDHDMWSKQVLLVMDMYFYTYDQFHHRHQQDIATVKGKYEECDEYDEMMKRNPYIHKPQQSFYRNPTLIIGLAAFFVFVARMAIQYMHLQQQPLRQPVEDGAEYYMK